MTLLFLYVSSVREIEVCYESPPREKRGSVGAYSTSYLRREICAVHVLLQNVFVYEIY